MMQSNDSWQVANLNAEELQKLQQFESQFKNTSGKGLVLIAYQQK